AVALRAGRRLLTIAHARAVAVVAWLIARDLRLALDAEHGLFEGQFQVKLDVAAARHRVFAPRPCGGAAEERFEQVAKPRAAAERISAAASAIERGVPKTVVGCSLLGIAEHFVGFVDFLEAIFSVA